MIFLCPRRMMTSDYPLGKQTKLFCLQLGSEGSTPFRNCNSDSYFKYRRMCETQKSKGLVTKSERCPFGNNSLEGNRDNVSSYLHKWAFKVGEKRKELKANYRQMWQGGKMNRNFRGQIRIRCPTLGGENYTCLPILNFITIIPMTSNS